VIILRLTSGDLATAIVVGEKTPWDELPSDSESDDPEEEIDHDKSNEIRQSNEMASTELSQIQSDVNEITTDLFRLSQTARNPAPHERFLQAVSTDTSHFLEHDRRHVENKFPNAEPSLLMHLGKAISKRRQYFKYREQHNQKLAQGLIGDEGDDSTVASSLPSKLKVQHSPPANLKPMNYTPSESGLSQTSYAGSEGDLTRPRVPSIDADYMDGSPFPCPFCFLIINVTSSHSWK
jgi:hypothetical protein